MSPGGVLVVNAGSSSIKTAVIGRGGEERLAVAATEIGGASALSVKRPGQDRHHSPGAFADHAAAMSSILDAMAAEGIQLGGLDAVGHRVVHGGPTLTRTTALTAQTLQTIASCAPLAPLHTPPALAAIDALSRLAPTLRQVACFDTAFHATIPEVAKRYALPDCAATAGLRRYGFHGISYAGLVQSLREMEPEGFPERLLALHLGNGASLCAIVDGQSVATTMGYSPLAGLTMGTRAGTIDGDAVLALAERLGVERAGELLNKQSGLKGLGGASDMRALSTDPSPEARFALDHFAYWAVRHAGSMVAAMGGCDAIAFTAGVGENDATMRGRIMAGLAWLGLVWDRDANRGNSPRLHGPGSAVAAWVVPAKEEATIARETLALLEAV